ncbi:MULTISPECIES: flavin reductase family protein [unclassified Symbiopectobacterium]|uniref:flavin reductase family protein n=1 Tax=unclassified Symbiopectobacterium TaxID=2794573 RepID=UPI002226C099|nr:MULTISPECIES: flavin reductase family protein [unclassified Symbiopectobacterium]MCW2475725.1 flavin reductase family protein [Candidatus Symbiopectobacterium sp. NZEC151]MCW2482116.1 flavin reductase family protein [Candidatus Symbiopectobacterium sp. NZEC135]MCW2486092.1 flavin reductase family protein [Candidatus Symbiopectobacterium sp. NZEC127]
MKKSVNVKSFYYGFPVFLASTRDPITQQLNIAPLSASFSLGNTLMIGVNKSNKTHDNIVAGSDVVINIPPHQLWSKIEQLGRVTGREIVPDSKLSQGFSYCSDKADLSGFTLEASTQVSPDRIADCPIQAECKTVDVIEKAAFILVELDIKQVWIDEYLLNEDGSLNTAQWNPLIYKFREYNTTTPAFGFNFKYGS